MTRTTMAFKTRRARRDERANSVDDFLFVGETIRVVVQQSHERLPVHGEHHTPLRSRRRGARRRPIRQQES